MEQQRRKEQAEALLFFMEHPEACSDEVVRAFVEMMRRKLEAQEQRQEQRQEHGLEQGQKQLTMGSL